MPYARDDDSDNIYMVRYKLSSSSTWLDWGANPKVHTASPFTDTITGLTKGETYDVRLTYIDWDGVKGISTQTVSVYIEDYETTVGAATAVMDTDTSIVVSMPYTKDDNTNNTYTVKYKLSSSGTWLDWGTNPKAHTASPYADTITGLTTGETYDVQMTYNDDVDGVNGTNPQTVTGILLSVNATMAGTATAAGVGDTSITFSMPYTFDNNVTNTYTVEYKLSSSGTWLDWGTNPKAHTTSPYTDTITGLTPGETYDVRMTYNDTDGINGTGQQTVSNITLTHNSTTVGTATAVGVSDTSIAVSMP